MQISPRGSNDTSSGFTLIEILIVLVIMAAAAGVMMVNLMPDDASRLQRIADTLAGQFEQAAQQAHVQGNDEGWFVDGRNAGFRVRQEEGGWAPIADSALWVMPDGLRVHGVELAGGNQPVLVFHASGVNQPFVMSLQLHAAGVRLVGNAMNRVDVGVVYHDE